jgi:hypothetical protein
MSKFADDLPEFAFPPAEAAMPAERRIEIGKWKFHPAELLAQVRLDSATKLRHIVLAIVIDNVESGVQVQDENVGVLDISRIRYWDEPKVELPGILAAKFIALDEAGEV